MTKKVARDQCTPYGPMEIHGFSVDDGGPCWCGKYASQAAYDRAHLRRPPPRKSLDNREEEWRTIGFIALLLGVIVGLLVVVLILVGKVAAETRIDLYDTKSNRTGSAVVTEGRVDFYDTKSNRTGYGTIDKGGRLDLYDRKSNRTGSGTIAPSRGRR